nr:SGNH/GDSL hydrolase family protein [Rhodopirellula sp. JC737]
MRLRLSWLFLICVCSVQPAWTQEKAAGTIADADPEMRASQTVEDGVAWFDVMDWEVEGRILPSHERQRWFDRFPQSADGKVTKNVWNLSRHSSGMMVRFRTDATELHVDYELMSDRLAMPHMPATGVSGVDFYARDENGDWRWVQVTRPSSSHVKTKVIDGLKPGLREYAAYLPLYNGVESMKIGVPEGTSLKPLPARSKPIVFYGTSITHGACASRPGMVHTAILGRRFDQPVVNLGFSGNGRMDESVGDYLVQLDAAVYVIDCLPNMHAEMVREKCQPLVRQLRAAKPGTPIVLVEDRRNTNSWILPARDAHHTANHQALREAYEALVSDGVTGLHYNSGR